MNFNPQFWIYQDSNEVFFKLFKNLGFFHWDLIVRSTGILILWLGLWDKLDRKRRTERKLVYLNWSKFYPEGKIRQF